MRIALRLLIELVVLAAGGAVLLTLPASLQLDPRDAAYYRQYHAWQSAFDALSIVTGCGLRTREPARDYTPTGRWILLAIGAAGAVCYVRAAAAALAALIGPAGHPSPRETHTPPRWSDALRTAAAWRLHVWLAVVLGPAVLLGGVMVGLDRLAGVHGPAANSFYDGVATYLSLGLTLARRTGPQAAVIVVPALAGGLGVPAVALCVPRLRRALAGLGRIWLGWLATYALWLLAAAALIALCEQPRGRTGQTATLAGAPPAKRWARAAAVSATVSPAGVSTEPLTEAASSEATRTAIAALVLVGSMPGSPGGGVKWPLFLAACASLAAAVGLWRRGCDPPTSRLRSAAVHLTLALVLTTVFVAIGLLAIEGLTASRFTPPPRLTDALLDAASAVGGAALTGGLTHAVTNQNLTAGIRLSVDMYPWGMGWLMAAMLAGRLLPVVILCRMSNGRTKSIEHASGAD